MGVRGGESGSCTLSLWLAPNPSKRWGDLFFLYYTPFWLFLCLGIVVPYKLYESFTELEYLLLAMISAVPSFLIPVLFVGKADRDLKFKDRYWVKASLWIIIFSYVGNYFWTHYFFTVLGASYTFPSWKMNDVPHTTFLLSHVCFLFYHVASNMTLRRLRHAIADLPEKLQWAIESAWILALAYFIAYLETLAISSFPYYEFVDRSSMYKVGSLFYAMYFMDRRETWRFMGLTKSNCRCSRCSNAGNHTTRFMAHLPRTCRSNARYKTMLSTCRTALDSYTSQWNLGRLRYVLRYETTIWYDINANGNRREWNMYILKFCLAVCIRNKNRNGSMFIIN
ncbi:cycloeucalenol cycloisomerase-like isoform X1 [Mercurialis annua]|uniref:cycloeucalenol cycloisomerase-like isoform X1 n=1 Tax=Mercurialis annua TaxID=3986 RepID=UPI0021610B9A|nr:cycloeucalenol cycloisomerase-like isoform X1 [Mercurialis annua]